MVIRDLIEEEAMVAEVAAVMVAIGLHVSCVADMAMMPTIVGTRLIRVLCLHQQLHHNFQISLRSLHKDQHRGHHHSIHQVRL